MKTLLKTSTTSVTKINLISPVKVKAETPVQVSKDIRRVISEVNDLESNYSVQFFKIHEAIPLGNHYHARKFEVFLILKGEGLLYTQALTKKEEKIGRIRRVVITAPCVVRMPSFVAHAFLLSPGSEMICYSSTAFEAKDHHAYPVIKSLKK